MKVSVIIPAYNAARTLEQPMASLRAQTHDDWEAIIVDDGSSDETRSLAEELARDDARIQVLSQTNAGVSAARNAGIARASADWLLFLDADDTMDPRHLERMIEALERDTSLDAVRCGWSSLSTDGYRTCTMMPRITGDLFARLAVDWQFAIHACVVRKSLAEAVGGFDTELCTSEDWDFWQRIARTGARFGAVREVLAFYHMRPASASKQAHRMLVDAIRVLEQGHAPDPRVPTPHPVHPQGFPAEPTVLQFQKSYFLCFSAGLAVGVGEDARPLLEVLRGQSDPTLEPYNVADWIVSAALDAKGRPLSEWHAAWREIEPKADEFLIALEDHAGVPGLRRRTLRLTRWMVAIKTVQVSPIHRLRGLAAHALLALTHAGQDLVTLGWTVADLLQMQATSALRMIPRFYARYRAFRQRYARPERPASLDQLFSRQADPWGYTNAYEQTKYEQTLELIPAGAAKVLEVGCAEGHFTAQLAPRVESLVATDISQVAVDRAAARCESEGNVQFETLDLATDSIPGCYDLIVCSEVLYYLGRPKRLQAVAEKLVAALEPGGQLVMAHANLTVDDPDHPGFDWSFNYGVKTIGETFSGLSSVKFVQELRTPYYRIQRFSKEAASERPIPEIRTVKASEPPPDVARHMVWNGVGNRLPILAYHRVAETGSEALAPYRVTPDAFEEQLRYLRDHGFRSIDLVDWSQHVVFGGALPRDSVLITFDDGYRDFKENAWPLLQRYGFSALVFLVADRIGGSNSWDEDHGEKVPLLDWRELRELQAGGVKFGSHTATHPWLPSLSWPKAVGELKRSKQVLEQGLGAPVNAVAYPWGAFNKSIQFFAGACGYEFGLSTAPGVCAASHSLLALPRLDIAGSDDIETFAAKLRPEESGAEPGSVDRSVREPVFI